MNSQVNNRCLHLLNPLSLVLSICVAFSSGCASRRVDFENQDSLAHRDDLFTPIIRSFSSNFPRMIVLKRAAQRFRAEQGKWPSSISDLVFDFEHENRNWSAEDFGETSFTELNDSLTINSKSPDNKSSFSIEIGSKVGAQ